MMSSLEANVDFNEFLEEIAELDVSQRIKREAIGFVGSRFSGSLRLDEQSRWRAFNGSIDVLAALNFEKETGLSWFFLNAVCGLAQSFKHQVVHADDGGFVGCLEKIESITWTLEKYRCEHCEREDRVLLDTKLIGIYSSLLTGLLHICESNALLRSDCLRYLSLNSSRREGKFNSSSLFLPLSLAEISGRVAQEEIGNLIESRNNLISAYSHLYNGGINPETSKTQVSPLRNDRIRFAGPDSADQATPEQMVDEEVRKEEMDFASTLKTARRQYRKVLNRIQRVVPEFSPERLKLTADPISAIKQTLANYFTIHIFLLGGCIRVNGFWNDQIVGMELDALASTQLLTLLHEARNARMGNLFVGEDADEETALQIERCMTPAVYSLREALVGASSILFVRFVVQPALMGIPFHNLKWASDRPLYEDLPSYYAESLGASGINQARARSSKVLVISPSEAGDDLQFAGVESAACWDHWTEVKRLKDGDASLANLLSEAPSCGVFHYCGHMRRNPESPLKSGLKLANQQRLTLGSCLTSPVVAPGSLVLLNACSSGRLIGEFLDPGTIQPETVRKTDELRFEKYLGDDAASFARAWLHAGAKTVVATLWDVDDLSAALFMWKLSKSVIPSEESWYGAEAIRETAIWLSSEITSGPDLTSRILPAFLEEAFGFEGTDEMKEKCLRRAQELTDLFSDAPPFASVYHWGAFVLLGCPVW